MYQCLISILKFNSVGDKINYWVIVNSTRIPVTYNGNEKVQCKLR